MMIRETFRFLTLPVRGRGKYSIALSACFFITTANAQSFTPPQRQEIETIIRDYLVKNPDVLKDSFAALEKKEAEKRAQAQAAAVEENRKLLFDSKNHAVIGNPKGDVTLVEFFDYNCSYCRSSQAGLKQLIAEDKNLRVVLKEYPVLGSGSIEAALIAAQLIPSDKYAAFHDALLASDAPVDQAAAVDAAKSLKLDHAKLQKGMQSDMARDVIKESYGLANALGINGTPGYVIGTKVFVGAQSVDSLKSAIANVRRCGKAEC